VADRSSVSIAPTEAPMNLRLAGEPPDVPPSPRTRVRERCKLLAPVFLKEAGTRNAVTRDRLGDSTSAPRSAREIRCSTQHFFDSALSCRFHGPTNVPSTDERQLRVYSDSPRRPRCKTRRHASVVSTVRSRGDRQQLLESVKQWRNRHLCAIAKASDAPRDYRRDSV